MMSEEVKTELEKSVILPPPHHIRRMVKWDVPEVLEVWKEIGLHEGTHTIESFLEVDPQGFYVAVSDENGMMIK